RVSASLMLTVPDHCDEGAICMRAERGALPQCRVSLQRSLPCNDHRARIIRCDTARVSPAKNAGLPAKSGARNDQNFNAGSHDQFVERLRGQKRDEGSTVGTDAEYHRTFAKFAIDPKWKPMGPPLPPGGAYPKATMDRLRDLREQQYESSNNRRRAIRPARAG